MSMRIAVGAAAAEVSTCQNGPASTCVDASDRIKCIHECNSSSSCILEDLQLAAELGKTLLERNKELECSLRQQQNVIDDQTQQIEYLTKQAAVLREVNNSRGRIYEQLELSVLELERTNERLTKDNETDRRKIRSLCSSIEVLESKCDQLHHSLSEVHTNERKRRCNERQQLSNLISHHQRLRRRCRHVCRSSSTPADLGCVLSVDTGLIKMPASDDDDIDDDQSEQTSCCSFEDLEQELTRVNNVVHELQAKCGREQRHREELEADLACLLQENLSLQERIGTLQERAEQALSLEDELIYLEEKNRSSLRISRLSPRCPSCGDEYISESEPSFTYSRRTTLPLLAIENDCSSDDSNKPILQSEKNTRPPCSFICNVQRRSLQTSDNSTSSLHSDYLLHTYQNRKSPPDRCLSLHDELQLSSEFSPPVSCSLPEDPPMSSQATQTDSASDAEGIRSRNNRIPDYHEIFQEIFAVLKRPLEHAEFSPSSSSTTSASQNHNKSFLTVSQSASQL